MGPKAERPKLKGINAVLIDSPDAARLAAFYRDRLGIPLEEERHGSEPHWACFLGNLHFAIHQANGTSTGSRSVAISFEAADVDGLVASLRSDGIPIEQEPQDRPFGRLAGVRDPDGNLVYLHRYPDSER